MENQTGTPPVEEAPVPLEVNPELVPEVADEAALPVEGQDVPPPSFPLKKPPLVLAAISFAVILLFIIGMLVIAAGSKKKNETKQTVQNTQPTSIPSIITPSPVEELTEQTWKTFESPTGNFKLDVPENKTVSYDTKNPSIEFCGIGSAEAGIHVASKENPGQKELDVIIAKHTASEETPQSWVNTNCKELLAYETEKGIIDEDGVKGLYYAKKYSSSTPDALPYTIAILQKGKKLFFVYGQGQSDAIMQDLFEPMFLSFKLLAK